MTETLCVNTSCLGLRFGILGTAYLQLSKLVFRPARGFPAVVKRAGRGRHAAVAAGRGRLGRRRTGDDARRRVAHIQRRCARQQEHGRHGQSRRHDGADRAPHRERERARGDGGVAPHAVPGGGEREGFAGRAAVALRRRGEQGGRDRRFIKKRRQGVDGGACRHHHLFKSIFSSGHPRLTD